jgi:hypothetical protein
MGRFRVPFCHDVFQRIGHVHCETNEDDVRVGVGEWADTVVIFLACRVVKGKFDVIAVELDGRDKVVEYGGNVLLHQ